MNSNESMLVQEKVRVLDKMVGFGKEIFFTLEKNNYL